MRAPRKTKSELRIAKAWKNFYEGEGRAAIAELFEKHHVYSPIVSTDPITMAIATGERNAVLHIARLIGLKPDRFADEAWGNHDILERVLHSAET